MENIKKAMQYCRLGQYEAAEQLCRRIIEQDTNQHEFLHVLGVLCARKKDYDSALTWLQKAIALKENECLYHSSLGNTYKALEKKNQAKKHYQRALQLNPEYAQAHNNLAILLYQDKDLKIAKAHYIRALHIQPDYLEAHFNLALLFLKEGKLDAAIKQFNHVIQLNPHSIAAHSELGEVYLHQNKLQQAQDHLEQVLAIDSEHLRALNNLGVVMLKLGHPMEAVNYFGEVLKRDQKNSHALNNIAATFLEQDWYENAMRHYRTLIELTPNDVEVNYNLAVACMGLGQLALAEEFFIKTLSLDPSHIEGHINLGAVLHKAGKHEQAAHYYQKALLLKPKDPLCEYMLQALQKPVSFAGQPERAPASYVSNLFDRYALHYDRHLVQSLSYTIPDQLAGMVSGYLEGAFPCWDILDLGCGTGLAAESIRPFVGERLLGLDLSDKMLQRAEKRQLYTELMQADLCDLSLLQQRENPYDLLIAADVLSYLGDLTPVFKQCMPLCKSQALFVFSVESLKEASSYQLQSTGRFKHGLAYVTQLAETQGFKRIQHKTTVGRKQGEEDVWFDLFLVQKIE